MEQMEIGVFCYLDYGNVFLIKINFLKANFHFQSLLLLIIIRFGILTVLKKKFVFCFIIVRFQTLRIRDVLSTLISID